MKCTVYQTRCPNSTEWKKIISSAVKTADDDLFKNVWKRDSTFISTVIRENFWLLGASLARSEYFERWAAPQKCLMQNIASKRFVYVSKKESEIFWTFL